MTPAKKEAQELIFKIYDTLLSAGNLQCFDEAKQCALIAVRKIIELCEFDCINDWMNQRNIDKLNYWDEVETEIRNYEKNIQIRT